MRLLSQIFQPLITIPKNATIKNTNISCKSQKLLMECGLIRPTSNGLYAILPLAQRSLNKLTQIICAHFEAAGCQRLSLPCLTSASLWRKSGRLTDSQELMRCTDRHEKEYLLAPTHEEAITDLMADVGPLTYKQLPLVLYQISNKYRDEFRPKHGLLRSREFQMLDVYGMHPDEACAKQVYLKLSSCYLDVFRELDLDCYRVPAPTGDIGGTYSHEWHVASTAGEDVVHVCASCAATSLSVPEQLGDENVLCSQCGGEVKGVTSIEVGHTFCLGTKYSQPLSASFVTSTQTSVPLTMTCYGIGVTRMGYPYIVVCGKAISDQPAKYELHNTRCKTMRLVTLTELLEELGGVNAKIDCEQKMDNKLY